MIQLVLNYLGIAVGAASGAVVGVRKGFDLFGIATMAVLTGVGGGLVRDMLLDLNPPRALQHWPSITICIAAAALTTVFAALVIRLNQLVAILDALTMGFFATSGAALSVENGASWMAAAILGVVTAVAGSIMRDVVAGEVPRIMGPDDLYAVPALLGSGLYVAIDYVGPQWVGVLVGSVVATLVRLAAIAFHWQLPTGPRDLIANQRGKPMS